jgi:hypothetical protein
MLSDITNLPITVGSGGIITLPAVTSIDYNRFFSGSNNIYSASGAGSAINFPNLTTLTMDNNNAAISEITIRASGSNSLVDMPMLNTVATPSNDQVEFQALSMGMLNLTGLTTFDPGTVTFNENGGTINLP